MDTYDFRGAYKPTGGRVGVRTGGAGRKRCTKGKSCGATCIAATKECWVDLGGKPGTNGGRNLHDATSKVRDLIKNRTGQGGSAEPKPQSTPQPQPKPQPTPQPKPTPQPEPKKESQREPDVKRAQNERLRREFAPKDGKVRSISINGKTDEEGTAAINAGLDSIRKNSADANKKIDSLMQALEKNPIPLIGRDVNVKPEDANVGGTVRGLAAAGTGLQKGRRVEEVVKSIQNTGLKAGAYAMMDSQMVVMTGDRTATQSKVSAKKANELLKQAQIANPLNGNWSTGAGSSYLHEVGHVMHARAFKGKSRGEIQAETEAQLKALGIKSVSQYGKTNAFEATAELYTAYMMNGPQLKKQMPAAYQWIDTLVQNAYNYTP